MRYGEIKFCCAVACQAEIEIVSLKDMNICFVVDCILEQLRGKDISLVVLVSTNVPVEHISQIF